MHSIKCRVCKQYFDTDSLSPDKWIMPATNMYYHRSCYEDWLRTKDDRTVNKTASDKEWFDKLKDYLWRDVKLPNIDFAKITSQWNNFLRKKEPTRMSAKGIYFAVIYYYDYKHGDRNLAEGGIGIVPSIYEDAASFWQNMNNKQQGIMDLVAKQKEMESKQRIIAAKNIEKKPLPKYSLDDVEVD